MDSPYGLLLKPKDLLLQRKYFEEMVRMIGVQVLHRAPRSGKSYTTYSEIESNYFEPEQTGCIFDEHPNLRTMKKLGWNSELLTDISIISVPYDLRGLQQGSLFEIPDPFDPTRKKLFRVTEMTSILIYPCSVTCKLVPEFEDTFSDNSYSHKTDSFNLLNREED